MPEQITIDYSKAKSKLLNILVKLNDFYLKLNQELVYFWRKLLSKQSNNWVTRVILTLLDNPATTLFLNTLLLAVISHIFGGTIGAILFYVAGLNIVVFCANILGWVDKLKK